MKIATFNANGIRARLPIVLDWLNRIQTSFSRHFDPDSPLIWTGDFNVAPESMDIYDPEKSALDSFALMTLDIIAI